MSYYTNKRSQLEAQRTANTREQAVLRNKLFNSPFPHHKTEEGQKMILDLLASSERVGLQIKAELETLRDCRETEEQTIVLCPSCGEDPQWAPDEAVLVGKECHACFENAIEAEMAKESEPTRTVSKPINLPGLDRGVQNYF